MRGTASTLRGKANFGVDAPIVMQGLLMAGDVLIFLGLVAGERISWRYGVAVAVLGFIPFAFGASMVFYSFVGKRRARDHMLRQLDLKGHEAVLDIGTGAGLLMIGAAKRLTTGRATGIDVWSKTDLSDNSIETTKRNIAIEGVADRTDVRTADARKLPFEDGSFDHAVSLLCLHNIKPKADRDTACREIARVLRPGGSVTIGDYVPTHDYAAVMRSAGLEVSRSGSAFLVAGGLMWILVARKPAAVATI